MKPNILYEDEAMLVCVKPCGVPAQGDKSNDEDMLTLLKNYIFDNGKSDEEPYLAAVHRLDRPVGGIMVFARTPEAAAKLSAQAADGTMVKFYQAIITGELPDDEGELVDFLANDPKTNKTIVVNKGDKGAKKAVLYYEVLDVMETDNGILSYVLIELETGRHHQIRAQFAARGCGIWGDTKYNPQFAKTKRMYREIGLHSSRIELEHPVTGEHMVFKNEPVGGAFDVIELDEF